MKTVFITGVNGFVGIHLARELHARKHTIIGVGHNKDLNPALQSVVAEYISCDLTDEEAVAKLDLAGIDAVISLAGLAKVGDSFAQPEKYKHTNVDVLAVLCERLIKERLQPRIIAVSSGVVYDSNQTMPLTETSRLVTQASPYALSKLEMEKAAWAFRTQGLPVIITRPFNHSGPGQQTGFLIPDLYQKIKSAQKGSGVLRAGNLATKRDYTDVRDVAKAYADLALAEDLQHDTYNVCSGGSVSGKEILKLLLEAMQAKTIKIEEDPSLLRPSDAQELFGSYKRIHDETGWQPAISLEQTIGDFVNIATPKQNDHF